jgi:hypothetical protein
MGINTSNMIFVFGSNIGGIHGAGAAKFAREHRGAAWGVGIGRTGQCYAIPTKGIRKTTNIAEQRSGGVGETLKLEEIKIFVDEFIDYACNNPQLQFQVTCIGCGLAGLRHEDIALMFKDAPANCWFDEAWKPFLEGTGAVYWGTFDARG